MITLNGVEYQVKFTRTPEPVTFYVKGKLRQTNRMATYCDLIADGAALPLARGRVTQSHKDIYNRKKATDAAFAAMLDNIEPGVKHSELRAEAARQFFSPKPRKPLQDVGGGCR